MQSIMGRRNASSHTYFCIYFYMWYTACGQSKTKVKLCCFRQPEKNLNFVDVFAGKVFNLN